MNGTDLRRFLTKSKFSYDEKTDAWIGPTGLIISDQFIVDMGDFHTSHAVEQIAEAVENDAKRLMAFVVNDRPTRIKIEWM